MDCEAGKGVGLENKGFLAWLDFDVDFPRPTDDLKMH